MKSTCCVVYSVCNRMTVHWGRREAALKILIDFKNRKVMGDVELKFNGNEKRIHCDSFLDAQDIYSIAEDWVNGEINSFFDYAESEEDEKDDGGNADGMQG